MARAEKNSDFRRIRKAAEAQGWTVEKTKNNHFKFTPPGGDSPVFFSGSPGEWRSLRNFVAALRQRGFRAPQRVQKGRG